jgi:mRNA interferase HigB
VGKNSVDSTGTFPNGAVRENGWQAWLNLILFPIRDIITISVTTSEEKMQLVNRKLIQQFVRRHPLARKPFERWMRDVTVAVLDSPRQVKERWPGASLLGNHLVVFNIHGNHYRILVDIDYEEGVVIVLRIGTHGEYDKWNL